jgi:hypothetical protein
MAARQSTYGTLATPAATTSFKSPLVAGGVAPTRVIGHLAETDASRDQGISFVSQDAAAGAPELYGRDDSIGLWLLAVLGSDAVTGTTPNYTHTITPASTLPYVSLWRNVSDILFESFADCKASTVTIAAQAGQPMTVTTGISGRTATRLTSDPSGPPPTAPNILLDAAQVYNYNDCNVTLSGGATALVSQFDLTIENTVTYQQTDNVIPYDVDEGQRVVTLNFDLIFANLNEYNAYHYGSTSGTAISPNIYTTSADFVFSHGTNNSIEFNLPVIAYEDFPVDINAAGNPIVVSVKAVGQRSTSPIITATVKNQVASY